MHGRPPMRPSLAVALALAGAAGVLAGCSSLKSYPNAGERNLEVRTRTESGSMFSSVRAAVHVHRVDTGCRLEYQGTVDLDRSPVRVAIPVDRSSYLVFTFASSSFPGGSRSTISQETTFRPRAGYRYDAEVTYRNDTYHVVLRELSAQPGAARELEFNGLGACSAGR